MKLRKLFMAGVFATSVVLPLTATAGTIDRVDLTSFGYDNVTGINFGDVTGGGYVTQSFNGGALTVGSTFTEDGFLQVDKWKSDPLTTVPSGLSSGDYEIYFVFSGLGGEITSIDLSGGFEYEFTPYLGEVKMYLDHTGANDVLDMGTAVELGTLEVVNGDGSIDPGGLQLDNDGDTNLQLLFTASVAGVFFDGSGNDMSEGTGTGFYAFGNLDNTVAGLSPIIGPQGLEGMNVMVSSNGVVHFEVPSPAPLALLGLGLMIAGVTRRKHKSA